MGYGCLNAQSVGANGEFEYRLAQEIAFYLFAKDFKERHGGGVFTSERSYLWEKDPNDKNSDLLFDVMATYFRNWVPPRSFKKNPSTRREGGILYEIHSVDLQRSKEVFDQLPQSIRQGIQQAFARAVRQNRSANELRLNPLDPDLFARNAAAKAKLREQMLLLGTALLVGVVLLCVFAPPAGAAAAGVVGGEVATMAAAETASLAVAGEEVFLGYRVAPMIRVAGELMRYEEAVNPAMELAEEMGRAVMMR